MGRCRSDELAQELAQAATREASPVAWPAVAEAAGWAVHVQPWPGYDDARGCWWRVCLVGGAARYSLGFTGARFARSWELAPAPPAPRARSPGARGAARVVEAMSAPRVLPEGGLLRVRCGARAS